MRFPKLLWVCLLLWSPSPAADPASSSVKIENIAFKANCSEQPVIVEVGEEASVSCYLSPQISAEQMELTWLNPNNQSVHVYHNGMDDASRQDHQYQGRTSLIKDQIQHGWVVLNISGVRPGDEGTYEFHAVSVSFFGKSKFELKVAARGFDPLIHVEHSQDGGLRLVCITQGWYPEPEVWWEGSDGQNLSTIVSRKQSGLNVTITIHTEDNYTCHVRSGLLNVTKTTTVSAAGSESSSWKTILITILVTGIILALITILFFWRHQGGILSGFFRCVPGQTGASAPTPDLKLDEGFKEKLLDVQDQGDPAKMQNLENQIEALKMKCHSITAPSRADFTLDPRTASHQLEFSADRKKVKFRPLNPAPRPPGSELAFQATCAMGCQAFTKGKHCWEVEVGSACSWALGAAVESVSRKGPPAPNPEHGIWAVGQSEGHYHAFTSPLTELSLDPPPEKVLVYLDMEAGQLSFYYADTLLPIYTFMCRFAGEVVAFIWTRDRDSWITVCPPPASIPGDRQRPSGGVLT